MLAKWAGNEVTLNPTVVIIRIPLTIKELQDLQPLVSGFHFGYYQFPRLFNSAFVGSGGIAH